MNEILKELNSAQCEAVTTIAGAVLVIAGAGSGKTRTLTHRVAYLIREKGVEPKYILAVTFTNKAAKEMKERIKDLLALKNTSFNQKTNVLNYNLPLVGTFHSVCVKILRQEIEKVGYHSSFNIYDDQDQLALIKKVMRELEISPEQFKPKAILGALSKAKNELIGPKNFIRDTGGYWEETAGKIYALYQKKLQSQNAVDFDDILMLTVQIFKTYPEVLEKYQNFFRYIMVDEYQDTNYAQYLLIKMLSQKHKNICVVGDDWQGIYSWRGANIQNILNFEKDYPKAKVIKLEQNYRSTQNILDAAYGVISKNVHRKDKKIWTKSKKGPLITSYEAEDEKDEAEFIIKEIKHLKDKKHYKLNDFVVLYRTNAQSRTIEEALLRNFIPYRIIGGVKFYQRKEIKDIIAYLRLIQNFKDEISLERIINEPKRGIGKVTFSRWITLAKKNHQSAIEAGLKLKNLLLSNTQSKKIQPSRIDTIVNFCNFVKQMSQDKNKLPLTSFIQKVYSQSGYEKYLLDGTEEGKIRHENTQELLT
ncbi:MAG TPA: ATP-dependent DNA helicase PcrA, partial [Candidatus Moranbacteria bacterium]|nr:ATP-dependent DNA helicase PcrA [Candidatus Moranbacteria bacterium]